MFLILALSLATLWGCQTKEAPPKEPASIKVLDGDAELARVLLGRPCRATVDGVEVLVGGRPLVAQVGADRWTGEDASNGTTLRKNDQIVARIHAKQLFDANGVPIMRVMVNGDIADKANAVVRKAIVDGNAVRIGSLTVTGTTDVAIAAFLTLTSRETVPEVRALAACHYLIEQQ